MSPRHLRSYIAASAASLTLLALALAGTAPGPSTLLLAIVGLVPPLVVPLWLGAPAAAIGETARRS